MDSRGGKWSKGFSTAKDPLLPNPGGGGPINNKQTSLGKRRETGDKDTGGRTYSKSTPQIGGAGTRGQASFVETMGKDGNSCIYSSR